MTDSSLDGAILHIRYVDLAQAVQWERNPKRHDIDGIIGAITRHGFRDAPIYDGTLGAIPAGNGRITALRTMQERGDDVPLGIAQDDEGRWFVPLQFGIDAPSLLAAQAFGVDHNNLTMAGGDFSAADILGMWETDEITALLGDISEGGEEIFSFDADDMAAILAGAGEEQEDREELARMTLVERFIVPPFSVLDARQGYWQARKKAWIDLGIRGELGRGITNIGMAHPETTSTIDFYARKRALEKQEGRELTKDEAAALIAEAGKLKNARAQNKARAYDTGVDRGSPGGMSAGMMRSEHVVGGEKHGKSMPNTSASSRAMQLAGGGSERHGARPHGSTPPHGPSVTQAADGTLHYKETTGTSVFDPVLCELVFRWFTPDGGKILDPFAGEATKGIVAEYLGYHYTGVELRQEQVEANKIQAEDIGVKPEWFCGDSAEIADLLPQGERYDLIFTSPPYYDLEIYSEKEKDGSAFETYEKFMTWYQSIFEQAVDRLNDDRFLVVKVGEIRDKKGDYRNFVGDNITCFLELGLKYYNEAILVTAVGSLPIRVGKQFSSGRKLGKTHQNILAFYKGDSRNIKNIFPKEIEYADFDEQEENKS